MTQEPVKYAFLCDFSDADYTANPQLRERFASASKLDSDELKGYGHYNKD